MSARVFSAFLLGTGLAAVAGDAAAVRTMIHKGYKYTCVSWCMIQPGTDVVVDAAGHPVRKERLYGSTPPPDCNQVDCGNN
jgi:hypothetical protein